MRRVFVSVPLSGRTEREIRADMEETMREYLRNAKDGEAILFINNYDGIASVDTRIAEAAEHPNLYYLGLALKKMSECNDVIFSKNWKTARGCRIEKLAYDLYFNKS